MALIDSFIAMLPPKVTLIPLIWEDTVYPSRQFGQGPRNAVTGQRRTLKGQEQKSPGDKVRLLTNEALNNQEHIRQDATIL
jgi:hypothetical protein